MEKKKKDCKLSSITSQERKEDQNQSSVGLAAEKYRTISISSHDNVQSLNHHFQPVVHWPYTTFYAMELQSPIVQSPSPAAHQVQHGQPLLHLAQQTMPVWPDNTLSGVNAHVSYQPFAMTGGGVPASNHAPIPSYCYHFGYPFPGFPGPWDPASWWGQPGPSLPPCTNSSPGPGAFAYVSSVPPPMPSSLATSSENFQRGIIKLPTKLSLKHQQLWGAQSAENVQLWAVFGQLQTELADCKSRLMMLESEVLSLKPKVEEPTCHGTGTSLAGKSSKRGRPEKQMSSVDASRSPLDSHLHARGGKPKLSNVQSETENQHFRKNHIIKVEGKENSCHSTGDMENLLYNHISGIEFSESNPLFHSQIQNDVRGAGLSSTESKACDGKNGASINLLGSTNDKKFECNSNTQSEVCGRELINVTSEPYDDDCNGVGGNSVVKWSFGNDDSTAIGVQNAAVESGKDEDDDEEMDDGESSSVEDIA
ncbi:hypothetical protein RHGRI_023264 [Rhododendron griersonianum]|uniref:Uncharacterized protein n=1 Tax=Rhododendron griersonianum TaxID=479676 RepID=A0AAV6J7C7_9ERIC|nr:hypothetical protein RHGRI_023264 [Rhododendron griersonianum]